MLSGPRIYNLFPLLAGPIDRWAERLPAIADMGFDTVYLNPIHQTGFSGSLYAVQDYRRLDSRVRGGGGGGDDDTQVRHFLSAAESSGLQVMMDLVVNHTAKDAVLVEEHPDWYVRDESGALASPFAVDPEDPSKRTVWGDLAELDWSGPSREAMIGYYADLVSHYIELGFHGFRCDAAYKVPATVWRSFLEVAKTVDPACFFCAETLGCTPAEVSALAGAGFDYLFNSVKWWDGRAPWFLEQYDLYRKIAPTIGFPESHDTPRLAADLARLPPHEVKAEYERRYLIAATLSAGVMIPMGYEAGARTALNVVSTRPEDAEQPAFDLTAFLRAANAMKAGIPALNGDGPLTRLSEPDAAVLIFAKGTEAVDDLAILLINTDRAGSRDISTDTVLSVTADDVVDLRDVTPGGDPVIGSKITLTPGEVRVLHAGFVRSVLEPDVPAERAAPPRVVVENIWPELDGGRFPVKRIEGDPFDVWADIYRDGHDKIAAGLRIRQFGEEQWRVLPMRFFDNDRWVARTKVDAIGPAHYAIEAWTDHFASWRDEVSKKRAAGLPLKLELIEGRTHLAEAVGRAQSIHRLRLERLEQECDSAPDEAALADILLSRAVANAIALVPDKGDRVLSEPMLEINVDREAARFSAWYEMFPRSQGTDPDRGATFADCVRRLPEIRDLGFDVVYLVPIHPIGEVNRKGRDNNPRAEPGEPGSPYAIGSRFGGHKDVSPELGTLEDFRAFQRAVRDHGMEVALDFAVQCAPDHPWLTEHPGWFRRRPDGSMRYAENPPKKYEDIVNVDFDQPDWRSLWDALLDAVLFWAGEGVRILRVDNPHTKPVAFWQWLIAEARKQYPDMLFLAEAFTRPKMMKRLAKIGFTQSYSYFTWRNTKAELTEYLTELTQGEAKEYFRPNFFVNTPDILPEFLQTSGRPGFRIRLVLAATLGSVYGIYNGFELCEAEAVPGKEEYAHSEKYEFKVWDWDRPGNIKDDVRRLNALRRASPALHFFTNLTFCRAWSDAVLFYMKRTADGGDTVFVAVNLDPKTVVEAEIEFPFETIGLAPEAEIETEELFSGERRRWAGARHMIKLDPEVNPSMVLRVVTPAAPGVSRTGVS